MRPVELNEEYSLVMGYGSGATCAKKLFQKLHSKIKCSALLVANQNAACQARPLRLTSGPVERSARSSRAMSTLL